MHDRDEKYIVYNIQVRNRERKGSLGRLNVKGRIISEWNFREVW
jgi:hypothetical protein